MEPNAMPLGTITSFIQQFKRNLNETFSSIRASIAAQFAPKPDYFEALGIDRDSVEDYGQWQYGQWQGIDPFLSNEPSEWIPEPNINFNSPLGFLTGALLVSGTLVSNLPSGRYARNSIHGDRGAYGALQQKVVGGAVVGAMMGLSSAVTETSASSIRARRQGSGTDVQINIQTTGDQTVFFGGSHTIASLPGSRFVAVWKEADSSGLGIKAQLFNSDFTRLGPAFQVNQYETNDQVEPVVAVNSRGEMIFAWSSEGQDGSSYGVFKRHFDTNGNSLSGDTQVNVATANFQGVPDITINPNDSYSIGWQSDETTVAWEPYVRAYDKNHNPLTSGVRINTSGGTVFQWGVALSRLGENNTAALWFSDGLDGSGYGIYGRELDENFNLITPEVQLHQNTTRAQEYPSCARLTDGRMVATWHSLHPGPTRSDVVARIFNSPLNATGPEFLINAMSSYSSAFPFAQSLPDNNFAVFMQNGLDDGSVNGIFGQFFNGLGANISAVFQVNSYTLGDQLYPSATLLENGKIAAMWQSNGQDGSGWGVFGTIIDPANYIVSVSISSSTSVVTTAISAITTANSGMTSIGPTSTISASTASMSAGSSASASTGAESSSSNEQGDSDSTGALIGISAATLLVGCGLGFFGGRVCKKGLITAGKGNDSEIDLEDIGQTRHHSDILQKPRTKTISHDSSSSTSEDGGIIYHTTGSVTPSVGGEITYNTTNITSPDDGVEEHYNTPR